MENSVNLMEYLPYMSKVRRHLHGIPELAYHEFETSAFVQAELDALGLPYTKIGTGIVARLELGRDRTVAYRADMDALPIEEQTDLTWRSRHAGIMHACGHDGHMSILLGLAKYCALNRENLGVNVRLIFQPAEEAEGGAVGMIAGGALEGVSEIFAVHLAPTVSMGVAGLCYGGVNAGALEFDIHCHGRSCHCAERENGADALLAGSRLVVDFQELLKSVDKPLLLHAGKVYSGVARNVVASDFQAECTMRYFARENRDLLYALIKSRAKELEVEYGVDFNFVERVEYCPLHNHRESVDKVKLIDSYKMIEPMYTAEDFAFYLEKVSGCMVWLGMYDGKEMRRLHTSNFYFEESVLLSGLQLFVELLRA